MKEGRVEREKIGHENINMRYERWWVLPPFKMLVAGATQYSSIRDAASAGERELTRSENAPHRVPLVFLTP